MKSIRKMSRIIAMLLVCMMVFVSCQGKTDDSEPSGGKDKDKDKGDSGAISGESYTSEQTHYIDEHLKYLEKGEYVTICYVPGGLASTIAKGYVEDNLKAIHGAWNSFSKFSLALTDGEVEFVHQYDPLVATLMQTSSAREAYEECLETEKYAGAYTFYKQVSDFLKTTDKFNDYLIDPDQYKEYGEAVKALDDLLDKISKGNYSLDLDAFTKVSDKIKSIAPEGLTKNIKAFSEGLGFFTSVVDTFSESFEELERQFIVLYSCTQATKEFAASWEEIYKKLNTGDKEQVEIANSIREFLDKMKASEEERQKMMMNDVAKKSAVNVIEMGISEVYSAFEDMLDAVPLIKSIRMGVKGGIAISNYVTNLDDLYFYGKMMFGCGLVADASFDVMQAAGKKLQSKKTYENAVLFDEAFNIYKNVQMACCNYGVSYCNAIINAKLPNFLKFNIKEKEVSKQLLREQRAEWAGRFCHDKIEVENNGGSVIRVGEDVYYWECAENCYSKTPAVNANFEMNKKAENKLTKLTPDGNKTVILTTAANAEMYYHHGIIYYYNSSKWLAYDLKKQASTSCPGKPVAYMECLDAFIYETDGAYYALDHDGNKHLLAKDSNLKYLGVTNSAFYYLSVGSKKMKLCEVDMTDYQQKELTTITTPKSFAGGALTTGNLVYDNEGIYFSMGVLQGTGFFYNNGGLYYVTFDGDCQVLVGHDDKNNLGFEDIYLRIDGEEKTLFYAIGDYAHFDFWGGAWASENVVQFDLKTHETKSAYFTVSRINSMIYDPKLNQAVMLRDNTGAYVRVCNEKLLKSLGYPGFGDVGNGEYVFLKRGYRIGDYAYFDVRYVTESPENAYGMRMAYTLNTYGLYRINVKDSNEGLETLYEITVK